MSGSAENSVEQVTIGSIHVTGGELYAQDPANADSLDRVVVLPARNGTWRAILRTGAHENLDLYLLHESVQSLVPTLEDRGSMYVWSGWAGVFVPGGLRPAGGDPVEIFEDILEALFGSEDDETPSKDYLALPYGCIANTGGDGGIEVFTASEQGEVIAIRLLISDDDGE